MRVSCKARTWRLYLCVSVIIFSLFVLSVQPLTLKVPTYIASFVREFSFILFFFRVYLLFQDGDLHEENVTVTE